MKKMYEMSLYKNRYMKNNNTSLKLTSFNSKVLSVVAYGNNAAFSRPPGVPMGRLTDLWSGENQVFCEYILSIKIYKLNSNS